MHCVQGNRGVFVVVVLVVVLFLNEVKTRDNQRFLLLIFISNVYSLLLTLAFYFLLNLSKNKSMGAKTEIVLVKLLGP